MIPDWTICGFRLDHFWSTLRPHICQNTKKFFKMFFQSVSLQQNTYLGQSLYPKSNSIAFQTHQRSQTLEAVKSKNEDAKCDFIFRN